MAIDFAVLKKDGIGDNPNFTAASGIADQLRRHLNMPRTQRQIRERHILGASSGAIQDIILRKAHQLGFQDEKKGLFGGYPVPALRPDYFCVLRDTGIILEVERGKTIPNNMDLLDLWKCHICDQASYLFLVVPQERRSASGSVLRNFQQARKRLAPFFEKRNYVNVDAVFLFGY